MGKKLAFWGDCNGYGYKIIRILEELGGINGSNYAGNEVILLYHIDKKNNIKGTHNGNLDKEKYVIMTYQDFIAKYPFQVGDIVYTTDNHEEGKVVEIVWDEKREEIKYYVGFENSISWMYADEIFSYIQFINDEEECGTSLKPSKMKIVLAELLEHIKTTSNDELEQEFKEIESEGWTNIGPTVEEFMTFCECVNKKSKYPKTFEECLNMLYCKAILKPIVGHKAELLLNLEKLLICRDAYWKIAGEQMGLGKSWESPLPSLFKTVYYIRRKNGEKIKGSYRGGKSEILEFPTEEMRDAFYENFKDLIEQCKELL